MAKRRRLEPAQPGYVAPVAAPAPSAELAATDTNPEAATGADAVTGIGARPTIAPIAQVSGQSAEAAALREMAAGLQAAREEGRMVVDVPLTDVAPGYLLRDRVALDRDELEALKSSIRAHGQRVPAEITPIQTAPGADGTTPHAFGLVSGWRRLTALNELHAETGEARFSTLRALIRAPEEAQASYLAMIEENEIRVGLSYFERARVVAELTKTGVFADQSAALRGLFGNASRAKRSKIGSFVDLVEAFGDVLSFPAEIPERLGLALISKLRLEGSSARHAIRARLASEAPSTAQDELALLEKLAQPTTSKDVSRAKQEAELVRPGLKLKTRGSGDKLVVTLSGDAVNHELVEKLRRLLTDM